MNDLISRLFNKRGLLEQIIIENQDKIAYEIALKNNDLSIYKNYLDVFEWIDLKDKGILGFTVRHYRVVDKTMYKTIRYNSMLIDLSFLITDFREKFNVKTSPKIIGVGFDNDYVEYYFAVPYLDAASDNRVKNILTKK